MNYSTKSKCLLHLVCNFFSVLYFCRATLKMISPVHHTCIALHYVVYFTTSLKIMGFLSVVLKLTSSLSHRSTSR